MKLSRRRVRDGCVSCSALDVRTKDDRGPGRRYGVHGSRKIGLGGYGGERRLDGDDPSCAARQNEKGSTTKAIRARREVTWRSNSASLAAGGASSTLSNRKWELAITLLVCTDILGAWYPERSERQPESVVGVLVGAAVCCGAEVWAIRHIKLHLETFRGFWPRGSPVGDKARVV